MNQHRYLFITIVSHKSILIIPIMATITPIGVSILEPDKLFEYIYNNLQPKHIEKTEKGEVFTPLDLVTYMLDNLDESYQKRNGRSIFAEPHFKWLDPAVGIGNFPIMVYQRLMSGLSTFFPNEESRRKHILENMLYMCELNVNNVEICSQIFCSKIYRLNLIEGDSLQLDLRRIWKNVTNDGFQVVFGNPPYNANGIKHKGDKNIYVYFSKKGLNEWLSPNGYLMFVHPPTYRIPHHKIQHTKTNLNEIYTNKTILCIKMYSIPQILKMMSVMMNVDFIIVQNTQGNPGVYKTKIIDVCNTEYYQVIHPNDFIPNYGLDILNKIKHKMIDRVSSSSSSSSQCIVLHLDSEVHAQHASGTTYKNVHGITSKGIKICLSDKKHTHYDSPKLIINGIGSYNYVFFDEKGEYGITQSPVYIVKPTANTYRMIQSPLFHYIANATKIIGNNFNTKTSLFLPIIPDNIKIENDCDLYDYFDFTLQERKMINIYSIPKYKNNFMVMSDNNTEE